MSCMFINKYSTDSWLYHPLCNYTMSSCRKTHNYISLNKHLTPCQNVFHAHESVESWKYCLEHCVHGRKGVNFIAIVHILQWASNVFHIVLKCMHVDQCKVWTPIYEVAPPPPPPGGVSVSTR